LRLGLEKGVATPVHEFQHRSLVPLDLKSRSEMAF